MKDFVTWLTALGLILTGLHFLGIHVNPFGWIDYWGESFGRSIRSVLAVGAIVLYAASVFDAPKTARQLFRARDRIGR